MLDIVNSYLRMWSKLSYADQWYTPPRGSEADRLGSMRWHRDYNDQHLVKVFVYLVDVDEGTGPFEYVPGSARSGPYADDWPWEPAGETYPPGDEFDQRVPSSAMKTFTAPAGSMIFCNTSGFHRGGFATEKPRNIFVYNYVSPAALEALVDRNFAVDASALGARRGRALCRDLRQGRLACESSSSCRMRARPATSSRRCAGWPSADTRSIWPRPDARRRTCPGSSDLANALVAEYPRMTSGASSAAAEGATGRGSPAGYASRWTTCATSTRSSADAPKLRRRAESFVAAADRAASRGRCPRPGQSALQPLERAAEPPRR